MKSSYRSTIELGEIISAVTFTCQPKLIVEIGILEGYSLTKFIEFSSTTTQIHAYDIFDKFNGHSAKRDDINNKFDKYPNVKISDGDFYDVYRAYLENEIDILHIDIANNGHVYEFVFNNYISKMRKGGIIILEGGSETRDQVEWMKKYEKPLIAPVINKYKKKYEIKVFGDFPSLTIIKV